ncbi:MAG: pilus assembly protein TadG-related protein [Rhizomicrobium sp.]|jgi:hypothetical protein
MLLKQFKRFLLNNNANVAMTFALALVPLIYLVGMGYDYTSASSREDQLGAIADAAALAAVTPAMMSKTDSASITAAQDTFNGQAGALPGVTYNGNSGLTVTVADSLTTRTVTVGFKATSQNAFPNILGMSGIALAGTSKAVGALAPNINFYLLLDSSPSMAIAATQTGINTMVANTSAQGGCAFGCHESDPKGESPALGNPNSEDNYALARSLGVTLRIDNVTTAVEDLMSTAQSTETENHASYEAAIYTFSTSVTSIAALTSNLSQAQTEAGNISLLEVYKNNYLTQTNANNDTDTDFDAAMTTLNTDMPNPGNGTNTKGDTPQEVLFLVTDGVEDESVNGSRQQSVIKTSDCTTIKNRGIRIAVLYTEYLPLPTNAWYNEYISPFQSNIGPTLQTCASPGLYYEVLTGGDISEALVDLFQKAVQTSYLAQ